MMDERNWRDAKIPQWVKDAVAKEQEALEITAALSWPTEAKPAPMPFRWGEYDSLKGEVQEGIFWICHHSHVQKLEIRFRDNLKEGEIDRSRYPQYKKVAFKVGDDERGFTTDVQRGPIFATEHDAWIFLLWNKCEEAAKKLMKLREKAR